MVCKKLITFVKLEKFSKNVIENPPLKGGF